MVDNIYKSQFGYIIKCDDATSGQISIDATHLKHVALTKTDLERLLEKMEGVSD